MRRPDAERHVFAASSAWQVIGIRRQPDPLAQFSVGLQLGLCRRVLGPHEHVSEVLMGAIREMSQSTQIAVGQREDVTPYPVGLVVLRLVPIGQEYREGDVRVRPEGDRDRRGKLRVHAVSMPDEAIENFCVSWSGTLLARTPGHAEGAIGRLWASGRVGRLAFVPRQTFVWELRVTRR